MAKKINFHDIDHEINHLIRHGIYSFHSMCTFHVDNGFIRAISLNFEWQVGGAEWNQTNSEPPLGVIREQGEWPLRRKT